MTYSIVKKIYRLAISFVLVFSSALSFAETSDFAQTVRRDESTGDFIGAGYDVGAGIYAGILDNAFFKASADAGLYVNILGSKLDVLRGETELHVDTKGAGFYADLDCCGNNIFYYEEGKPRETQGSTTNTLSTLPSDKITENLANLKRAVQDNFSKTDRALAKFQEARHCPNMSTNAFEVLSGIKIMTEQCSDCALFINDQDIENAINDPEHRTRKLLRAVSAAYDGIHTNDQDLVIMLRDVLYSQSLQPDVVLPKEPYIAGNVPFFKEKAGISYTFMVVCVPVEVSAGTSGEIGLDYSLSARHTIEDVPLDDHWNMTRYVACDRPEVNIKLYGDFGMYAQALAGVKGLLALGVNGSASLIRDEIVIDSKACLFTHPSFDAELSNVYHEPSGRIRLFVEYPTIEIYTQCHRVLWWKVCHPWVRIGSAKAYHTLCEFIGRQHKTVLAHYTTKQPGDPGKGWTATDRVFDGGAEDPNNPRVLSWDKPSVVRENSGQIKAVLTYAKPLASGVRIPVFWEGSATRGNDYTMDSSSFIIPAGGRSAEILVSLTKDYEEEGTESIGFYCSNGNGGWNRPNETVQLHNVTPAFYSLTPQTATNGTILPSESVEVEDGTRRKFRFYPAENYHVSDVHVDGVSVGAASEYTFENVQDDHTIKAVFQLNRLQLTAESALHGTISPEGVTEVEYGGNQVYSFVPDAGYEVASICIDGTTKAKTDSFTFENIDANHSVGATFSLINLDNSLSVGDFEHVGQVENTTVSYEFVVGESFDHPVSNSALRVIYKAHSQSRTNGRKNGVHLRIYKDGVLLEERVDQYNSESSFGTPIPGYDHEQLFYDLGLSVGDELRIDMEVRNGDWKNYVSTLRVESLWEGYTITPDSIVNGSSTPAEAVVLAPGGSQTFTFEPEAHYHVDDILVDGISVGATNSYTFENVMKNHCFDVVFALDRYELSPIVSSNGLIKPSSPVEVEYGNDYTFTFDPYAHHHVSDVLVDGTSVGAANSYTFNAVATNHTIEAQFDLNTYYVTPLNLTNGVLTPSGPVGIKAGKSGIITFEPVPHYHIADVLVDHESVGATNTYRFENMQTNHTLEVLFEINKYTLTPISSPLGTTDPANPVTIEYNQSHSFSFMPIDAYEVVDVLVDGIAQGKTYDYAFLNVESNHALEAVYAPMDLKSKTDIQDYALLEILENRTDSYTFTVGDGVAAGTRLSALEVLYTAHSQSGSNYAKNHVVLKVYKDGVLIAEYDDAYTSQSLVGTPIPGFERVHRFYGLAVQPGDEITLEIQVRAGDYINYLSTMDVVSYWDIAKSHYRIEASAGRGGSISPNGLTWVPCNSNQLFTIEPDEGFDIRTLKVNGIAIESTSSYTFTNVNTEHVIDTDFYWTNAAFHFPQNTRTSFGLSPTARDHEIAEQIYLEWRNAHSTTNGAGGFLRVLWDDQKSTVSEGIGYGLLLAVNYNDKALFDGLWGYHNLHLDTNGLMHWKIDENGDISGSGAATDSDQDIAFALIVAHDQWGSAGAIDYISEAQTLLERIYLHEVESGTYVLKPGDEWGGSDVLNPSYFRTGYYRLFGAVSGNRGWEKVLAKSYEILDVAAHPETGLVPDWCQVDGSAVDPSAYPNNNSYKYTYDAVRTPMFTALDYLWYGSPEAYTFCERLVGFFNDVGVDNIMDGYTLDGTPEANWNQPIFVYTVAIAALAIEDDQETCDSFYHKTVSEETLGYYGQSLKALALMMLSGNFYVPEYPMITTRAYGQGHVEPAGNLFVLPGGDQTYSFDPFEGHDVDEILIDGEFISRTNKYTFMSVTNDHVLEIYFADIDTVHDGVTNYYVSLTGSHTAPFSTWPTAATNIQAAVDLADSGETVWITNGTYDVGSKRAKESLLPSRVVIRKGITVRSVNGPKQTIIMGGADSESGANGQGAIRGVQVTQSAKGALLMGLTIENGFTFATTNDSISIDHMGGGVCQMAGTLSNCIVRGCSAGFAGGVFCSDSLIDKSMVYSNTATGAGGGIYMNNAKVQNTVLYGNTASYGGGIFCWSKGNTITSCLLYENEASNDGGGCFGGDIIQSTISRNHAVNGGGACNSALTNSIVYYNTTDNYQNSTFEHSCSTPTPAGQGNLSEEPLFVNHNGNDYHLQLNSPAIDSGSDLDFIAVDMDGLPRPKDGDGDEQENFDMGAYEFVTTDFDGDKIPDAWEKAYFDGALSCGADKDSDNDGLNNFAEYVFGTNPTNAMDGRVLGLSATSGLEFELNVQSCTSRLYTVYCSESLSSSNWTELTSFEGNGNEVLVNDPNTNSPQKYYQIKAEIK